MLDDKHFKIVKKRYHYFNPPYPPETNGEFPTLLFKDMPSYALILQPPLQKDKSGKPTNVRDWPGLGLDSCKLILGTRLLQLNKSGAGKLLTFKTFHGWGTMVDDKWAAAYTE